MWNIICLIRLTRCVILSDLLFAYDGVDLRDSHKYKGNKVKYLRQISLLTVMNNTKTLLLLLLLL